MTSREGDKNLEPREFLEAFYRSLRAHLEQEHLLGRAQERKHKGRLKKRR